MVLGARPTSKTSAVITLQERIIIRHLVIWAQALVRRYQLCLVDGVMVSGSVCFIGFSEAIVS